MRYIFLAVVLATAFGVTLAGHATGIESYNLTARSGAQLYAKECVSCHGRDGRSTTSKGRVKHARNLADAEWQSNVSDERIFNSIMNGKRKMPGYARKFSEQEIETLVAYVRALRR